MEPRPTAALDVRECIKIWPGRHNSEEGDACLLTRHVVQSRERERHPKVRGTRHRGRVGAELRRAPLVDASGPVQRDRVIRADVIRRTRRPQIAAAGCRALEVCARGASEKVVVIDGHFCVLPRVIDPATAELLVNIASTEWMKYVLNAAGASSRS